MKRYFWIFLVFLFSCQGPGGKKKNDIISVSILPQKYFVERIAGDLVQVNVLIPPGASPATYSLIPSQMKDIVNSKAWFRMGYLGFELSWADRIQNANPDMKTFVLSDGIDLITEKDEEHGSHHHEGGVDPHFWMSPREVSIIAENILKALEELYPDHEKTFLENFEKLEKDIADVDAHIRLVLRNAKNRSFLVFHPALTYFARQYGLKQIALENMGKEPSPRQVKEVVKLARKKNIKCIFIQKEFDHENAQIIAKEIGGTVIQINPLNYDWIEQMEETTENLKKVLN